MLNNTDIIIRPFVESDAQDIAKFYNRYKYGVAQYGYQLTSEDILTLMKRLGTISRILAFDGDRLIATVSFDKTRGQKSIGEKAVMGGSLLLDPQYRGSFIVPQMYGEGLKILVNMGIDKICSEVWTDNKNAYYLNRRMGFCWTSKSYINYNDFIELYNFMPKILRYLFGIFRKYVPIELRDFDFESSWRIICGDKDLKCFGRNSTFWRDMEVVEYNFNTRFFGGIRCKIDVEKENIVFLETQQYILEKYNDKDTVFWRIYNKVNQQINYKIDLEPSDLKVTNVPELKGSLPEGKEAIVTLPVSYLVDNKFRSLFRISTLEIPFELDNIKECGEEVTFPQNSLTVGNIKSKINGLKLHIENLFLRLEVDLITGMVLLYQDECLMLRENWPDLGPPLLNGIFNPRKLNLKASLAKMENGIVAEIWEERSHIILCKKILVDSGSLVKIQVQVQNIGDKLINAEAAIYPWVELHNVQLSVPLKTGLLKEPLIFRKFPFSLNNYEYFQNSDLPRSSDSYLKFWSCFTSGEKTVALIWNDANEIYYGLNWMPMLFYKLPTINMGQTYSLPEYYFYSGSGDWRTVDGLWDKLYNHHMETDDRETSMLSLHFPDGAIFEGTKDLNISGELVTISRNPIKGKIYFECSGEQKCTSKTVSFETHAVNPFSFEEKLVSGKVNPGCYTTRAHIITDDFDRTYKFPLILATDTEKDVIISPVDSTENSTTCVDNGFIKFEVAPEHDGSVVSIQCCGKEWLLTSFPKVKHFSKCIEWYGGIKPTFLKDNYNLKQNLTQEKTGCKFRLSAVERQGKKGISWSGVRLVPEKMPKEYDEANYSVEYLTAAGSNILIVRQELNNESDDKLNFASMIKAFFNFSPPYRSILYFYCNGKIHNIKGNPGLEICDTGNWAAQGLQSKKGPYWVMVSPSKVLGSIKGCKWWIDSIHMVDSRQLVLAPRETKVVYTYLIYAQDFKMATNYRCLKDHLLIKD